MQINADFSLRAVVHAAQLPWVASPIAGVERRMLDRIGGEVARATTIVRYAPGSAFPAHEHKGGEEFLVLDGVFQDEDGDFPAGSYVRNPPASRHTPRSATGCTIFVKLWQFDPHDRTPVRIDTAAAPFADDPAHAGFRMLPLHRDALETVSLEIWPAHAHVPLDGDGGMEILVLEGSFEQAGEALSELSWLRLPPGTRTMGLTGDGGAKVWIKRGHLREPARAFGLMNKLRQGADRSQ